MELYLYKMLQGLYWLVLLFLVFSFIYCIIKPRREYNKVISRRSVILKRLSVSGVLFLIYFLLIFPVVREELLVQTECQISKIETDRNFDPTRIFVTFALDNKKYDERVTMRDSSYYLNNRFSENTNMICWYDQLEPSRVLLEPPSHAGALRDILFSLLFFIIGNIGLQLLFIQAKKIRDIIYNRPD